MITWYQVYAKDKVYGFSANRTHIIDHPDRFWIGRTLDQFKRQGLKGIYQITKIADICE